MITLSNNRSTANATVPSEPTINDMTAKEALRAHVDQLSLEQQMDFVVAALQLIDNRSMRNTPFAKVQRKAAQC